MPGSWGYEGSRRLRSNPSSEGVSISGPSPSSSRARQGVRSPPCGGSLRPLRGVQSSSLLEQKAFSDEFSPFLQVQARCAVGSTQEQPGDPRNEEAEE